MTRFVVAALLAVVTALSPVALAREAVVTGEICAEQLPAEARETLALIKRGGPFPYHKDGVVFGNREHRLPSQPPDYYTEYTVKTPRQRDRGARRIVAGRGAARDPSASGEYYYTDDHYNSFRRICE